MISETVSQKAATRRLNSNRFVLNETAVEAMIPPMLLKRDFR
jgi:hypothetical protein